MGFLNSLDAARKQDKEDALRHFRNEFLIPVVNHNEAIYFLGNSLGLQPKRTEAAIKQVLAQWQQYGVEAFFKSSNPWLSFHDQLTKPLAEIVGAMPDEIVVMNQLTVNLHLMLASFYQPHGARTKIICEAKAFPSDQYMLETHLRQRGLNPDDHIIEVAPRDGETTIRHEAILQAIEENKDTIALLFWGGVNYYTGQVFNMNALTEAAHAAGALAGFDLAHAAGNVPLQLHDWNVDFACWCSYKYLNAGPGAVAGTFVHQRHHHKKLQRFGGWWGYEKNARFKMQKGFQPIASAEGWALSTPSPILFAAHLASLQIFSEAGMETILNKSRQQSRFLFFVLHEVLKKFSTTPFTILTPENETERGCQVSIFMPGIGRRVFDWLTENNMFADWREPDVIRIAPVPLYNTIEDVWRFGMLLEQALQNIQQA